MLKISFGIIVIVNANHGIEHPSHTYKKIHSQISPKFLHGATAIETGYTSTLVS